MKPCNHHSRDNHRHGSNWLPRSGDLGGVGTAPPGFHSKGRVSHPGRVSKDSEMKSFFSRFQRLAVWHHSRGTMH